MLICRITIIIISCEVLFSIDSRSILNMSCPEEGQERSVKLNNFRKRTFCNSQLQQNHVQYLPRAVVYTSFNIIMRKNSYDPVHYC